VGDSLVYMALRGRAFVVVDEFEFWAQAIAEKAKRSAKLKENRFMMSSS
jgi:hypothetical protein